MTDRRVIPSPLPKRGDLTFYSDGSVSIRDNFPAGGYWFKDITLAPSEKEPKMQNESDNDAREWDTNRSDLDMDMTWQDWTFVAIWSGVFGCAGFLVHAWFFGPVCQ